jgi:hypothetical protein
MESFKEETEILGEPCRCCALKNLENAIEKKVEKYVRLPLK